MIIYQNEAGKITLYADAEHGYHYDPSAQQLNARQGRLDKIDLPGMDGAHTFAASLSGTTLRLEGTGLIYNIRQALGMLLPIALRMKNERDLLCRLFDPRKPGVLIYKPSDGADAYRLEGVRATGTPTFGNIIGATFDFAVDLQADAARWETVHVYTAALGTLAGGLTFPCTFPIRFGVASGTEIEIYNPTPETIYPRIILRENRAGVELQNTNTGETWRVERAVRFDERLVADTDPRRVSIRYQQCVAGEWKDVQDASAWLSLDSGDMHIKPGRNVLRMVNGECRQGGAVILEWRKPWMGV